MPGRAIYSLLTNDATVSGLVGTRVYPGMAPQGCARPFIVYQRVSGEAYPDLDGMTGIVKSRVQVDCYANTYQAASALYAAAIAALDVSPGTYGGIELASILRDTAPQDFIETEVDPKLYRVQQDFSAIYAE